MLVDAECSISMAEKPGPTLGPYFRNRIGEVNVTMAELSKVCPVEQLMHIPSHLNPADLPTRGLAEPEEIGPGSMWQDGPDFLWLERSEWPVSRDFVSVIHEEAKWIKLVCFSAEIHPLPSMTTRQLLTIYLAQFSSDDLEKVTQIVARVIHGRVHGRDAIYEHPNVARLEEAKTLLFRINQLYVVKRFEKGKLVSLSLYFNEKGVLVTQGRLGHGMEIVLGQKELAILFPGSRLAVLIMWATHRRLHCGTPANAAATSRSYAWIIRPRQLAISVRRKCPLCHLMHIRLGRQIMGLRKPEHLIQCPPFTHVACDLLGPFVCKAMVKARDTMKVWWVLYVCQATGAARAFLAPGYVVLASP